MASCTGTKKTMDTDIEAIRFGNGGGVTGAADIFILKRDGTLAKEDREQQQESVKTIDKKTTASLFEKAGLIKDYRYHKPGNMYSFIELVKPSGNNNITWGIPVGVDSAVIRLYKELSLLSRIAE